MLFGRFFSSSWNGGAGKHHQPGHRLIFVVGAVTPVNPIGLAELGDLFDPGQKCLMPGTSLPSVIVSGSKM